MYLCLIKCTALPIPSLIAIIGVLGAATNITIRPNPWRRLKRFLFGAPIATDRASHERLNVALGLPVFASDALSSVAYATEAILGVLILSSLALFRDQIWIGAAISLLIIIVATSY